MEPLSIFLATLAAAAFSDGRRSPPPADGKDEDLGWAVEFVAERARRWAGEWSKGVDGEWGDPAGAFAQIWASELAEARRDRRLLAEWDDAHDLLGGQEEVVFRNFLELYRVGGTEAVDALVEKYGSDPSLLFPLRSDVRVETSPFGWRTHPTLGTRKFHEGQDLRAADGTAVLAAESGVVAYVTTTGACGWGICLEHGPTTRTIYCHLSRIDVKKGQRVERGQQIGLSGGRKGHPGAGRSTAAHLHFAVKTRPSAKGNWSYVDPDQFVVAQGAGAEGGGDGWWDWVASFWADGPVEEEDQGPTSSQAVWDTAPGVSAVIVDADGAEHDPGAVPAGRYVLSVSGREPAHVVLAAGHRYKASTLGRMYEQ